ncbi:LysE family translocator [Sphingomonas radiodurans]|uniref:LysE family translocator n=1 Tax=Sphingomonas radiodurans TaxID=2890321 RepID=UPI001E282AF0|nr:LysE family transporter [Sphingomonas radiodurans]WBH15273.1 LysE family transporter [Sphingomonas radiodurans]
MNNGLLFTLILAMLVYSAKPGPGALAAISQLVTRGWPATLGFSLGNQIVDLGVLILLTVIYFNFGQLPIISLARTIAAVFLLLYALRAIYAQIKHQELIKESGIAKGSFRSGFKWGILINVFNPVIWSFHSVLVPYIISSTSPFLYMMLFCIILMVCDVTGRAMYLGFAGMLKDHFQYTSTWRAISIFFNIVFAFIAIALLVYS